MLQGGSKVPQIQFMTKVIKNSLESSEASIEIAVLNGLLYLLEAQAFKVLYPLTLVLT